VKPQQFTLDLFLPPAPTLANFVPGANAPVLAALGEALAGRGPQFIHLWGPPGSGRSHLIAAVRGAAQEAALAAVAGPQAAGPHLRAVPRWSPGVRLYGIDDVHLLDAAGQAVLFQLQDGVRQHPGSFLVSAADLPPAQLPLREDVRTRLAWGLVFALHPIAETDQAAALAAYARARGARVDDELVPFMLTRLPRDMRTLVQVLDALDAYALARHRDLTIPLLRAWLQEQGR